MQPGEIGSSRADAIARGLKTFTPSTPCRHGSFAPRRVTGGCLCDACKAENVRRAVEWQKANPEAFRATKAKTRANNKPTARAYYERTRDRRAEQARQWREANPERAAEHKKRWAAANREYLLALTKARKEAEKRAKPAWYSRWDTFVLNEALDLAKRREAATGIRWERDHLIPIQGKDASGLHCAANIQVIPAALNYWKGNRMRLTEPGQWISHL